MERGVEGGFLCQTWLKLSRELDEWKPLVKGQPLGDVTGYADAAAACGASAPEQKLECDALKDCIGFSRLRSGWGGCQEQVLALDRRWISSSTSARRHEHSSSE